MCGYHSTVKPKSSLFRPALHRHRAARLALAAALLLASPLLLPSVSGAQNLPTLGDSTQDELSPLTERKLGERVMRDIRRNRNYLDDAPVQEYLSSLGDILLTARPEARGEAQYDFFFFAVRDPMLNAFALPGGFIGVHSALVLAAQNESELASVMAHEIGHVSQRHIARMFGKQKQDALLPLASLVLAALAANSSPDAAMGIAMGGQGLAIQRQLDFSRDAEREADRVGLETLRAAGFETDGMIAFFGRMQNATRGYNDTAPAFLRSHPMTTERIADIQTRTRGQRYKQRADSLDFHLIQSRLRVLQDLSGDGLRNAAGVFERELQQNVKNATVAGKYGLAFVALRQGDEVKAQNLLQDARKAAGGKNAIIASLGIDIRLAARQHAEAVAEADAARKDFPLSRGIAHQYAQALIAAGRFDEATAYLRDQAQLYRQEVRLHELLAEAYAGQRREAQQHMALAEAYALSGSLPSALEQLTIARRSRDATFYDQAVIDAREREFKAQRLEEINEEKGGRG